MSKIGNTTPPAFEHYIDDRLLRLPEVLKVLPISRSLLYSRIKDGTFPKPLKFGDRISLWPESEIRDLIEGEKRRRG